MDYLSSVSTGSRDAQQKERTKREKNEIRPHVIDGPPRLQRTARDTTTSEIIATCAEAHAKPLPLR